jgi:hypothetical protein
VVRRRRSHGACVEEAGSHPSGVEEAGRGAGVEEMGPNHRVAWEVKRKGAVRMWARKTELAQAVREAERLGRSRHGFPNAHNRPDVHVLVLQ